MQDKGRMRLPSKNSWDPRKGGAENVMENARCPFRRYAHPAIQRVEETAPALIHIIFNKSAIMVTTLSAAAHSGQQDITRIQLDQWGCRAIWHKARPKVVPFLSDVFRRKHWRAAEHQRSKNGLPTHEALRDLGQHLKVRPRAPNQPYPPRSQAVSGSRRNLLKTDFPSRHSYKFIKPFLRLFSGR